MKKVPSAICVHYGAFVHPGTFYMKSAACDMYNLYYIGYYKYTCTSIFKLYYINDIMTEQATIEFIFNKYFECEGLFINYFLTIFRRFAYVSINR